VEFFKKKGGDTIKEYSPEISTFSCVLKGDLQSLEEIKDYITTYATKGLISLVKTAYDKKELYIVTEDQWKYYQLLKKRSEGFIFYDASEGSEGHDTFFWVM